MFIFLADKMKTMVLLVDTIYFEACDKQVKIVTKDRTMIYYGKISNVANNQILQDGKPHKPYDIATLLNISTQTVYQRIKILRENGIDIETRKGKNSGYIMASY